MVDGGGGSGGLGEMGRCQRRQQTTRTEHSGGKEWDRGAKAHDLDRRHHVGAVVGACERVKVRGFVRVGR